MVHSAGYFALGRGAVDHLKTPHLRAAAVAVLLTVLLACLLTYEARRFESEHERRTSLVFFPQKSNGSALQRLAFKLSHYLPIYGSSELGSYELQKRVKTKPGDFFVSRPTGFLTYPVGRGGTTPLVMLQEIASVGDTVRGHKLVIVLSPNWFSGPLNVGNYEGNATLLHLGNLLFGTWSDSLKQATAKRLAQFPNTLAKSDLLRLETQLYAEGSPRDLVLAHLLNPFGRSWLFLLRVMDDWKTVTELLSTARHFPEPPPVQHRSVNWADEEVDAEAVSNIEATWVGHAPEDGDPPTEMPPVGPLKKRIRASGVEFASSDVWGDYELLLRVLHETGAKALILSVPQDGPISDKNGVTFPVRNVYYQRVRQLAAQYGYPARTFEEHEYDGNFLIEHVSHLTDKGWLFLDEVIDAFYHDQLHS